MGRKTDELELAEALRYAEIPKLPQEFTAASRKIWVSAIAKVSKRSGETSYAIVRNDYGKSPKIVKVFGSISAISGIVAVYPYEFLEKDLYASYKTEQEKSALLSKVYGYTEKKIAELPQEDRDRMFYSYLIDTQRKCQRSK